MKTLTILFTLVSGGFTLLKARGNVAPKEYNNFRKQPRYQCWDAVLFIV
jgi:hypothetical protein